LTQDCGSEHCITCSDEAIPMSVVEIGTDGIAVCADEDGVRREVITDLVAPIGSGDAVLVHAGVALSRVTENAEHFR
jgi:hydrogenase maturation factor